MTLSTADTLAAAAVPLDTPACPRSTGAMPSDDLARIVLAHIDAISTAEAARRVAPVWGCSPDSAESRLIRWRAHVDGRGSGRDITSRPLFQLLTVLGLTVGPVAAGGTG